MPDKGHYTTQQAAKLLKIPVKTLREMCTNGEVDGAYKRGNGPVKHWQIPMDWVADRLDGARIGEQSYQTPIPGTDGGEFMEQGHPVIEIADQQADHETPEAEQDVAFTIHPSEEPSPVQDPKPAPKPKPKSSSRRPSVSPQPSRNPLSGTEAERGLASLAMTIDGSEVIRDIQVYRKDELEGTWEYIDELQSLSSNPRKDIQDLRPDGGVFSITYWDATRKKTIKWPPFKVAPKPGFGQGGMGGSWNQHGMPGMPEGAFSSRYPHGGQGQSSDAGLTAQMVAPVIAKMTEAVFDRQDDSEKSLLEVYHEGESKGLAGMKSIFDQIMADKASERERIQGDIAKIRAQAEEDRQRDRELFQHLAKEREEIARGREQDRDAFYKNMNDSTNKVLELQQQQIEIQKRHSEEVINLRREALETERRYWEELRTMKESQKPWEAFFKMLGPSLEKIADKAETLMGQISANRKQEGGRGIGSDKQIEEGKPGEPSEEVEAEIQDEPEPTVEEVKEVLSNTPFEEIIQTTKTSHFYPQLISNVKKCLTFNIPPSYFLEKVVEGIEKNPEIPFIVRAMGAMEDPMTFLDPPHVDVPEEDIAFIRSKGKDWLERLRDALAEWSAKHGEYFSDSQPEEVIETAPVEEN